MYYAQIDFEVNGEKFWDTLKASHPDLHAKLGDELTPVTREEMQIISSTPGYFTGMKRAPRCVEFLSQEEAEDFGYI